MECIAQSLTMKSNPPWDGLLEDFIKTDGEAPEVIDNILSLFRYIATAVRHSLTDQKSCGLAGLSTTTKDQGSKSLPGRLDC